MRIRLDEITLITFGGYGLFMRIFGIIIFIFLTLYVGWRVFRLSKVNESEKYINKYEELYIKTDRSIFDNQKSTFSSFRSFFMKLTKEELTFQKSELRSILDDMKQFPMLSIAVSLLIAFITYIFGTNKDLTKTLPMRTEELSKVINENGISGTETISKVTYMKGINFFGKLYSPDIFFSNLSILIYIVVLTILLMTLLNHLVKIKKLNLYFDLLEDHIKFRNTWDELHQNSVPNNT